MSIKDELGGRTLAELGEVMAPPKPRSWADVEERADEARQAAEFLAFADEAADEFDAEAEADERADDTPAVYLHEHRNKQGRVVTSWFARR